MTFDKLNKNITSNKENIHLLKKRIIMHVPNYLKYPYIFKSKRELCLCNKDI